MSKHQQPTKEETHAASLPPRHPARFGPAGSGPSVQLTNGTANPKANVGSFNSHHSHFIALYSHLFTHRLLTTPQVRSLLADRTSRVATQVHDTQPRNAMLTRRMFSRLVTTNRLGQRAPLRIRFHINAPRAPSLSLGGGSSGDGGRSCSRGFSCNFSSTPERGAPPIKGQELTSVAFGWANQTVPLILAGVVILGIG